jgi:hypothetical protein
LQTEAAELAARIRAQELRQAELKSLSDYCSQVSERLDNFDFDKKRMLVEALKTPVEVDGTNYRLTIKIPSESGKPITIQSAARRQ